MARSPGVDSVTSYWPGGARTLKSRDGASALVLAHVAGSDQQLTRRAHALAARFSHPAGPVNVRAGGPAGTFAAVGSQINKDLALGEAVAVPASLVLLVLAFGSVVAALLPVVIGVAAIFTTLAVLWLLGTITSVSVYALNLTSGMGLGLAIDYSLLMVNRYREEAATGCDPAAAVRRAVATAGRTIVFSAATVAAALAALMVFPVYFLRSFAYAGISVVALATAAAVLVLPALLAVLGSRVNAVAVRGHDRLGRAESRFWRGVASRVMGRPVMAGLPVVVGLVVLAAPFLRVHFGAPDDRVLPLSAPARQVGDALRTQFPADASDTVEVVTSAALPAADTAGYQRRLARLPGVVAVVARTGARTTWLSLTIAPDSQSPAAQALVQRVRHLAPPAGVDVYVGGAAAALVDQKHDIGSRLPLAVGLMVLATFVVLFGFTGSVVLPVKALVLSLLSLTAVFGAVVWVFQEGHLAGVLRFTPTPTSTTMPLLLFCIAFGLSMDYEVFMLARIKEGHDGGATNVEAVAAGLARAGRIVTTAAGLLAVTFVAFGLSKVSFIKLFGLGTALAIVVDATLVRGVLVPSFMRLAGDANWWAPAPLRRLHRRIGLSEGSPVPT